MDVKHGGVRTALLGLTFFLLHCSGSYTHQGFVNASSSCGRLADSTQYVVHWKSGQSSVVKARSKEDFLQNFFQSRERDIAWAEHDYPIQLPEAVGSIQPFSDLSNPQWGLERIGAPEVWAQGVFGAGTLVAVVDTGLDVEHIKLKNSLYINSGEVFDGQDNDGNGYVDDVSGYDFIDGTGRMTDLRGHGTQVAGIIAGDHVHGLSRGVAPAAKILPLRTISENSGSAAQAARAIRYAASQGAHIVNASWGGPFCSETLFQAVRELEKKDILFVAASGNDHQSLDKVGVYPAGFDLPHQLTVGASGPTDLLSAFSNYSATKVHLLAPGFFIWSTVPGQREGPENGTSMSAPFVSGAAALLKSAFPEASMLEIRQALLEGVDSPPVIGQRQVDYPVISGGRLNVWRSYQILSSLQLN